MKGFESLIEEIGRAAAGFAIPGPALVAIVVAALVVAWLLGGKLSRPARYRRGRFMSANERAFLRALDAALGVHYRAFAQVRLAELVDVEEGASEERRRDALRKTFGKSVDFVICDARSFEPVAIIEVDDRTHLLPERRERDAFVDAVCKEIDLPLLRVAAGRAYSAARLREIFAEAGVVGMSPERNGGAN